MEGKYTDAISRAKARTRPRRRGRHESHRQRARFRGLNVYTPDYVRPDSSPLGYEVLKRQTSYPHMASGWLYIGPEVIYWAVRNVSDIWKPKELYITENGCSADDVSRRTACRRHGSRHVSAQPLNSFAPGCC